MSKELGFTTELHHGRNYMMFYCKKTGETLYHKILPRREDVEARQENASGNDVSEVWEASSGERVPLPPPEQEG